jgi:Domain of unknown function (DUF4262)
MRDKSTRNHHRGTSHRYESKEERNMDRLAHMRETIPAMIAKHGCFIFAVMPEEGSQGFTYSVGISELAEGMPELLVVNLPMNIAHSLIMDAYTKMKSCGEPPEDGDLLTDSGTGAGTKMEFRFKSVQPGDTMGQHRSWILWPRGYSRHADSLA